MSNPDLLKMARWCRWMLAFVFIYHGLVPKVLFLNPVEVQMVEAAGLGLNAQIISPLAGVAEVLLGLLILFGWFGRWPVLAAALGLLGLLAGVALVTPALLLGAFNPVTTNLPALLLCALIIRLEAGCNTAA
ncbi:DoxX-like family protein [Halopseudomonas aestusnigri]|uniref:DoxX-like family protein n=1 Tax=Halopseudomonas aestusnigri TaxID=857252 RepID=UPI002552F74B|nr:DoxX-like family protein [Halopseudomonas aestusnigri]MDL2198861.1 DoxX-like family protein [Halopseudomonas aestusnigri]